MKFAIITHVVHKQVDNEWFAYAPYVREMRLWEKFVGKVQIVSPFSKEETHSNEIAYKNENINHILIPSFNILSLKNILKTVIVIPKIGFRIYKSMKWADHIHLRCPGNIGLLGCFIQILFPSKPKTVKYAGNWDPKSKQPFSYRLQKWVLSNTYLTKNCKVLVYGEWENQSKNILPFFTATYHKKEIEKIEDKNLKGTINLLFVGNLTSGKRPILAVKVTHELLKKEYKVFLHIYGEGKERKAIEDYIKENKLESHIFLYGITSKAQVKKAFQKANFLLFISKSEGWPKVVAEAMFWQCVPITTKVSCVPYMLGNGERGTIVSDDLDTILIVLESYFENNNLYNSHKKNAMSWSQQFTLDKFEKEIEKILKI